MPATKKRSFLSKLTNGFIVGNADNDPAGISTYTLTGSQTGFSLALFLILSTPLLINIQAICARIGDVTKKGLGSVIRLYYGKPIAIISMILVIFANILTLGADFAGISAGLNLIFPKINHIFFMPVIAIILWYIVTFKSYKIVARFFAGLGIVFLGYIITVFMLEPNWLDVGRQILFPSLSWHPQFWLIATAMMGTTITPFVFYWQVTEEIENHPTVKDVKTEIGQVSWGLVWSNLISVFIIIACALTLYQNHLEVASAADAALALKPFAGNFASLLFAIGIIGSGMLATPVLASTTAYTVAETFNWKNGLNQKINQAKGFYTILTASFIVGLTIALLKINPIKMLFYTQVVSGLITPFILILIIILATKAVIMKEYVISKKQQFIGWITVLVMVFSGLAAFLMPK